MKHIFFSSLLAAGLFCMAPAAEAKVDDLLPKPHQLTRCNGAAFLLGRPVAITDQSNCAYLTKVFINAGCTIDANATAKVTVEYVTTIDGAFNHKLAEYPDEAYALNITENEVRIKVLTDMGVVRAAQTLQQLAEGYDGTAALEALTMTDWPAFKLRGFMHDVGRSFYTFDELKKQIDLLARFKVNTFHWHLTEYTGWRIEVKKYPQLTAPENQGRYPGQYYTQAEASELVAFARERGVTIIPEIDMPGHSHVFDTAMGFGMQTDQGVAALKDILDELCAVFKDCPYIHLGGDEVSITYANFLETMSDYVRKKGQKVVMWNPIKGKTPSGTICDMTQMWSTSGNVIKGLPNIDCRYNYTNHFDVYADLVGIYKSSIYYAQQGTDDIAGTISCAWNDTKVPTQDDITRQNNIYANVMASAERAWYGGGKQYIEEGGTTLPNSGEEFEEFGDFERRFLFHKAHSLKNEPIAYVKQTNVKWRITDPFPNGGNNALALPPETCTAETLPESFEHNGQVYGTHVATGGGIWLRHIWHPTVPSFLANPAANQTAYAWTYVYSEQEQDVAAQVEFYNYSRSGAEKMPPAGAWDRRGSKLWVNGAEIEAPLWEQPDANIAQNHATQELKNENFTARDVTPIHLNAGWNKVFMRLPHVNNGGTARDKWQFTFVLVDKDGKNAVDGLIYSPTKSKDAASEELAILMSDISSYIGQNFSADLGAYPITLAKPLQDKMAEVSATLSDESVTAEQRAAQVEELNAELASLKEAVKTAEINKPRLTTADETHTYTIKDVRGSKFITAAAAGATPTGVTSIGDDAYWTVEKCTETTYNLKSAKTGLYLTTGITMSATAPTDGWELKTSAAKGAFIIVSGNKQLHQPTGTNLINWGSGTNTTDGGCQFVFAEVVLPETPKLSDSKMYYWYTFNTPLRDNRYATATAEEGGLMGNASASAASEWIFADRGDETFDIVNRQYGCYIAPYAAYNTQLQTTMEQPATGWKFLNAATNGYFCIVSGNVESNQTNSGLSYKVYNWGSGTNTSDTGCQYAFYFKEKAVPTGIATTLAPNTKQAYFDLLGRRVAKPTKGIYVMNGKKVIF